MPKKPVKRVRTPRPKTQNTERQMKCNNCYYARRIGQSAMVDCLVDLPPFLMRSNDPRKHRVHNSYSCFAWTPIADEEREQE